MRRFVLGLCYVTDRSSGFVSERLRSVPSRAPHASSFQPHASPHTSWRPLGSQSYPEPCWSYSDKFLYAAANHIWAVLVVVNILISFTIRLQANSLSFPQERQTQFINSSPPMRIKRSFARMVFRAFSVTERINSSPASWPKVSLTLQAVNIQKAYAHLVNAYPVTTVVYFSKPVRFTPSAGHRD